jgi:hypothetical protein
VPHSSRVGSQITGCSNLYRLTPPRACPRLLLAVAPPTAQMAQTKPGAQWEARFGCRSSVCESRAQSTSRPVPRHHFSDTADARMAYPPKVLEVAAESADDDLLADRAFVAALAGLSEVLVMYDLLSLEPKNIQEMTCVEKDTAPFLSGLAPFEVEGRAPKEGDATCFVRIKCCEYAHILKSKYAARVVEWIDVERVTEKQVCILELTHNPQRPVIVVAFRGSRTTEDWLLVNSNQFHQPLFLPIDEEGGSVEAVGPPRLMHWLKHSRKTCISLGMWKAYDGRKRPIVRKKLAARAMSGSTPPANEGADPRMSPRARVRAAVERLLSSHAASGQRPQLIITGHSMGKWGRRETVQRPRAPSPTAAECGAIPRLCVPLHARARLCVPLHARAPVRPIACAPAPVRPIACARACASHCMRAPVRPGSRARALR